MRPPSAGTDRGDQQLVDHACQEDHTQENPAVVIELTVNRDTITEMISHAMRPA